jgi:hypothetical protein
MSNLLLGEISMQKWWKNGLNLWKICESIDFSPDCDALIWAYNSDGHYSTSSLYSIISYQGITPIFVPAMWSLVVPPRVHIFLWLLSNNKLMTRDNLKKRHLGKPISCEFCSEPETISHLFFDCIVARRSWSSVSNFLNLQLGSDFESVARFWLANKKHWVTNSICAAVMWSIWKTRNSMIFDGQSKHIYSNMYIILGVRGPFFQLCPRAPKNIEPALLQRVEHHDLFTEVCTWLEDAVRDTFFLHGWQHNLCAGHAS